MKNLALVAVLFGAFAVVALLFFWDDASATDGPDTVVDPESAPVVEDGSGGEAVDLVVDAEPGPVDVEPVELVDAEPATSEREALDDRLDGRSWADLLFPVSTEDGAPIEGARIIHVDHRGERREVSLDAPILADDLHERALAAIDTDEHCFRAFLPRELAEHTGDPVHVALHPSTRIRFELIGEEPEVWPVFQAVVSSQWFLDGATEEMEELGLEEIEEIQPIFAFAQNLRFILFGASEPKYRRKQIRWAARTEVVRPLLELTGAPAVFGHTNAKVAPVASLPLVIDDLPIGTEVDVYPEFEDEPTLVRFIGPEGRELNWLDDETFALEAESSVLIEVDFPPPATVLGSIAPGHAGGAVNVAALDEDGDPSWFETWEAEIAEDGSFAVSGLPPGEFDLTAAWADAAGARFQAQRRFELVSGQVLDLGRLDAATGGSVTFRPVLVVDGVEDPTFLGGAFDDFAWDLSMVQEVVFDEAAYDELEDWQLEDEAFMQSFWEAQQPDEVPSYESEVVGLAETTFGNVEPGRYWVSTFFWELPEAVAAGYRVIGFEEFEVLDVSGDTVRELRFEIESAAMLQIVAEVPALGVGYDQWLTLVAWNADGDVRTFEDLDMTYASSSDQPWSIDATVPIDPGTWEFALVVRCEIDTWLFDDEEEMPDLPPKSFVASTSFSVAAVGSNDRLDFQLVPGATLRGTEKAYRGNDDEWGWVQLSPVGAPEDVGELWSVFPDGDGPDVGSGGEVLFVIDGLLPSTEYAVQFSENTVTTGASGSVVDVLE